MKINLKDTMKLYREYSEKTARLNDCERHADHMSAKGMQIARQEHTAAWLALRDDKGYKELSDELREVNYRCTARTVSAQTVLEDLAAVEDRLRITKKAMEGTFVKIDHHAQNFPKAYAKASHGTSAQSTKVVAQYSKGGWVIGGLYREACGKQAYSISLSETAKQAILEKASVLNL